VTKYLISYIPQPENNYGRSNKVQKQ